MTEISSNPNMVTVPLNGLSRPQLEQVAKDHVQAKSPSAIKQIVDNLETMQKDGVNLVYDKSLSPEMRLINVFDYPPSIPAVTVDGTPSANVMGELSNPFLKSSLVAALAVVTLELVSLIGKEKQVEFKIAAETVVNMFQISQEIAAGTMKTAEAVAAKLHEQGNEIVKNAWISFGVQMGMTLGSIGASCGARAKHNKAKMSEKMYHQKLTQKNDAMRAKANAMPPGTKKVTLKSKVRRNDAVLKTDNKGNYSNDFNQKYGKLQKKGQSAENTLFIADAAMRSADMVGRVINAYGEKIQKDIEAVKTLIEAKGQAAEQILQAIKETEHKRQEGAQKALNELQEHVKTALDLLKEVSRNFSQSFSINASGRG